MCYECNFKNIAKTIAIFISLILIITLIILIINQKNENQPDVLVAIARNGDNTQAGTTTIKFSQNNIVAVSYTHLR